MIVSKPDGWMLDVIATLFVEQDPQDFGRIPPLGFGRRDHLGRVGAQIGKPKATSELEQLFGQQGCGLGCHRPNPSHERVPCDKFCAMSAWTCWLGPPGWRDR